MADDLSEATQEIWNKTQTCTEPFEVINKGPKHLPHKIQRPGIFLYCYVSLIFHKALKIELGAYSVYYSSIFYTDKGILSNTATSFFFPLKDQDATDIW